MDAHLKDKDIDRLVSGIMGRREILRAEKHLEVCGSCSRKASVLKGILKEQKNDSLPGENVKAAVIAEWHRMNPGIKSGVKTPRLNLGLAYGFAAAVIIAVSAYFALTRISHTVYEEGLSAASITGEVQINNTAAGIDYKLDEGDVVATGTDSSVTLSVESYNLLLEGSSELKLAQINSETGFLFILNRGAVTSRSEGKLKYAFICGGYRIAPSGTEFRIEMSERDVAVSVRSGMVVVSGADLKIEVPAGKIWYSTDPLNLKSSDNGNISDEKKVTADAEKNVQEAEGNIRKRDEVVPDEIRDFKKDAREEIREMKKESRKGRQMKGGN